MLQKLILTLLIASLLVFGNASYVYAATPPEFPSCLTPQGEVKVSYSTGTHGIVGTNQTYTGSDVVYTLSDGNLTQCFCSDNGEGIQTNWWKIAGLTESEIQSLKNQGWFYIPNGSLWGLDEAEYMAKNITYSCKSSGGGGNGGGDNSSNNNGSSGSGGGDILPTGASTGDVLGLASTGSLPTILTLLFMGATSALAGFVLKKNLS